MFSKKMFTLFALIAILASAACVAQTNTPAPNATTIPNMANPASVFCEQNGGKLELTQDASGGSLGMCHFPDGSVCEEWAFNRGECKPGDSLASGKATAPAANMANPASVYCEQNGGKVDLRQDAAGVAGICIFPDNSECDEWAYFRGECKPGGAAPAGSTATLDPDGTASDGWKVYRDARLGFSFQVPADASISSADDPLKTLTISGPLVGNEYWPVIYFNFPSDREDYRPPEDVNLAQWLVDHYLLIGERQPDLQIAGTTAIHTRQARSPQSYASDHYFFAHAGQLYGIVILHTGDKEDWTLYNHFLESIQF